jgi:hypothetical protein
MVRHIEQGVAASAPISLMARGKEHGHGLPPIYHTPIGVEHSSHSTSHVICLSKSTVARWIFCFRAP